jgi:hypothetical protein
MLAGEKLKHLRKLLIIQSFEKVEEAEVKNRGHSGEYKLGSLWIIPSKEGVWHRFKSQITWEKCFLVVEGKKHSSQRWERKAVHLSQQPKKKV